MTRYAFTGEAKALSPEEVERVREVVRSGPWATVRRARKAGRPVRIFPLRAGNTVP